MAFSWLMANFDMLQISMQHPHVSLLQSLPSLHSPLSEIYVTKNCFGKSLTLCPKGVNELIKWAHLIVFIL